jgi:flavin reductase (DIM6/NTAB) family NADH-FMN oxidoreductase RutF
MLTFKPTDTFEVLNGLNPFKSVAIPRPIGWISTVSKDGIANLAPYSQFNNVGFDPPYVMFAAQQTIECTRKHTVINAEDSKFFVHNMVTYDLREKMNITARVSSIEVDEFEEAGLTKLASVCGNAPRVKESPIQMECKYITTLRLPGTKPFSHSDIVVGEVVMIHIDEQYITPEGKLDIIKLRPLSRLGYMDYTSVTDQFTMAVKNMTSNPVPGSFTWMSPSKKTNK